MSFDVDKYGGYGAGTLGNVTLSGSDNFNKSAYIKEVNGTTITCCGDNIDKTSDDDEVLILVHNGDNIGKFEVRKIISSSYNNQYGYGETTLVLDDELTYVRYRCPAQVIKINQYRNLTIPEGAQFRARDMVDDTSDGAYGGVVAIKCSGTLTLSGGHINLKDNGLMPYGGCSFIEKRAETPQEQSGKLDADSQAGAENSITKDRLIMNIGDGAAFILAKDIVVQNDASRIGNPDSQGVQYCRGAADSPNKPEGVSNIGGSTILIATERILYNGSLVDFTPAFISKYRTMTAAEIEAGAVDDEKFRGLARAYIAIAYRHSTDTSYEVSRYLNHDEGLYALDVIKNKTRLSTYLNIKNFGNGKKGNIIFESGYSCESVNNYALVANPISGWNSTITLSNKIISNSAPAFAVGSLIMIHTTVKSEASITAVNLYWNNYFALNRIKAVDGDTITLETPLRCDPNKYIYQVITIPEYADCTVNTLIGDRIPKWEGGVGGIFAIACSGTLDLRNGGKICVEGKGSDIDNPIPFYGNYSMNARLPIGAGHGSVFILARNIIMDDNTRIGADYDTSGYLVNGQAYAILDNNLGPGRYFVSADCEGDDKYKEAHASTQFKINPA